MKENAQKIDYEYDNGVFDLVRNDPKFSNIEDNLLEVEKEINRLVDEWKENTQNNY